MAHKQGRPNILYIICHDLGRHLGCYGAGVYTPNLDRFAEQGVRFEQAYCSAPQCTPSRGALVTSRPTWLNGLLGLAHMEWEYAFREVLMYDYLKRLGYSTNLFGVQHQIVPEKIDKLGIDNIFVKNRDEEYIKVAASRFIRWLRSKPGGPWFAQLGSREPHQPFPYEDTDRYKLDEREVVIPDFYPSEFANLPNLRAEIRGLNTLVRHMDYHVGRALIELDNQGLTDDTLVIFTTDHGVAIPGAKGTCYDAGMEVTLLMRYPKGFEGGKVLPQLVSNWDLLPTLINLLNYQDEPDNTLYGVDFTSILLGKTDDNIRDVIFGGMDYHDQEVRMRMIRDEVFKLILNLEPGGRPRLYFPKDIDNSKAGRSRKIKEWGYAQGRPDVELYDLAKDPFERHNLAGKHGYKGVQGDLERRLRNFRLETQDPWLVGNGVSPTMATILRRGIEAHSASDRGQNHWSFQERKRRRKAYSHSRSRSNGPPKRRGKHRDTHRSQRR